MSKLSLDRDQIDQCRDLAAEIIRSIIQNVNRHTTLSIERSTLRMLGIEGALEEDSKEPAPQGRYPLVNALLDKIGAERLHKGAGYWFGLAAAHYPRLTPSTLARKIVAEEIVLEKLEPAPADKIDEICQTHLGKTIAKLRAIGEKKKKRPAWPLSSAPLRYVIVATGNIREDIWQAQAAAEMGADIIAVIRSTAQSLLDYVPEGETTEGFGGTFATQENFRLMRQALDQSEKKLKRRIGLTNYSSGLCMPEIAVLGALEGVDYLLNDAMYGILFRDINMKRNFVDQYFSRRICALSGITIQTGEDNYLTTADSHKYYYQVLASHFINESFAKAAGIPENQISLGHAHEIDPWVEDSILYEWAQAQLIREVFPRSPIKFMPPTKHKGGDIFFSYLYDGLFNLAGILTGQSIQLMGMHTEAIHNPFVQDRFLSLKNANYIFKGAKSIKDEILFQSNGKIARRARQVMDEAMGLLKKIKLRGLMRSIEEGAFANVKRFPDGGKGVEGVFEKDRDYYTPLREYLSPKQDVREEDPRRSIRGRGRDRLSGGEESRGRRPGREFEGESSREGRPVPMGEGEREPRRELGRGRGDRNRDRDRDRGRGRGRGRGRERDRGPRPQGGPVPVANPSIGNEMDRPVQAPPSEAEVMSSELSTVEAVIYLPPPGEPLAEAPSAVSEEAPEFSNDGNEVEASSESAPSPEGNDASAGDERRSYGGRGRRRGRRGGRGRGRRGGRNGTRPPMGAAEGGSERSEAAGGRETSAPEHSEAPTSGGDESGGNE